MKLSEARTLWHRYVWWWTDGAVSGPNEWAKVLLKKDMKIAKLEVENQTFQELFVYFFGENYEELAGGDDEHTTRV